jgi:hypothetical protein
MERYQWGIWPNKSLNWATFSAGTPKAVSYLDRSANQGGNF